MTPDELKTIAQSLHGARWQKKLADSLHVDRSTVSRWASGAVPVPGPVDAAVRCFLKLKRARK